jgi:hypothetical protein
MPSAPTTSVTSAPTTLPPASPARGKHGEVSGYNANAVDAAREHPPIGRALPDDMLAGRQPPGSPRTGSESYSLI